MTFQMTDSESFAGDILVGSKALAIEIYNDGSQTAQRRVWYLAETNKLPTFKIGRNICARRSVLRRFFESQEAEAFASAVVAPKTAPPPPAKVFVAGRR